MQNIKQKVIVFFATGGLIGFSPVAPGTFGSLAALPLCLFLARLPLKSESILILVLVLVSVWIAHIAEKLAGQKDPKRVVIDEVCGMAVTMFALPFTPISAICGFALFRVFDILKPFPIRWVEKNVSGGLGIVLDDIIAGMVANALLRMGIYIL